MTAPWVWAASLACIAIQPPATWRINGTVRDVQAYPIPGATVTIVGETTSAEVVSDPGGAFRFAELPAGRYSVTVTMPGFRSRSNRSSYVVIGRWIL